MPFKVDPRESLGLGPRFGGPPDPYADPNDIEGGDPFGFTTPTNPAVLGQGQPSQGQGGGQITGLEAEPPAGLRPGFRWEKVLASRQVPTGGVNDLGEPVFVDQPLFIWYQVPDTTPKYQQLFQLDDGIYGITPSGEYTKVIDIKKGEVIESNVEVDPNTGLGVRRYYVNEFDQAGNVTGQREIESRPIEAPAVLTPAQEATLKQRELEFDYQKKQDEINRIQSEKDRAEAQRQFDEDRRIREAQDIRAEGRAQVTEANAQKRFEAQQAAEKQKGLIEALRLSQTAQNAPLFTAIAATGQTPRGTGRPFGATLGQPQPGLGPEVNPFVSKQQVLANLGRSNVDTSGLPSPLARAAAIAQQQRLAGVLPFPGSTGAVSPAYIDTPQGRVLAGTDEFLRLRAQGYEPQASPLTSAQQEALRLPAPAELLAMSPAEQQAKANAFAGFRLGISTPAELLAASRGELAKSFGGASRFSALSSGAAVTPQAAKANQKRFEARKRKEAQKQVPFQTARAQGRRRFGVRA